MLRWQVGFLDSSRQLLILSQQIAGSPVVAVTMSTDAGPELCVGIELSTGPVVAI